jgi:hypothetical protein
LKKENLEWPTKILQSSVLSQMLTTLNLSEDVHKMKLSYYNDNLQARVIPLTTQGNTINRFDILSVYTKLFIPSLREHVLMD